MIEDLTENHLRKGMTYFEIIDLIGEPNFKRDKEKNTIGYEIMVNQGWDIDPVETKTLLIELTPDSLVKSYKVEHWKRQING